MRPHLRTLFTAVASAFVVSAAAAQTPPTTAQPSFYLGPTLGYTAVVSSPEGSSVSGTPARLSIGADLVKPFSDVAALRLSLAYRIEQAEFNTQVEPTARPKVQTLRLDVGEPDPEQAPFVISRQNLGSLEMSASVQFTLLPLGKDGSHVFAGIGGMIDNVMAATQKDDWTNVPQLPSDYPEEWEYDLGSQLGIGGIAYAGVALSLGTARLVGDVRFVSRTPLGDGRIYEWLAARGVRIGMGVWFPL